jgi:hypothetical protein
LVGRHFRLEDGGKIGYSGVGGRGADLLGIRRLVCGWKSDVVAFWILEQNLPESYRWKGTR